MISFMKNERLLLVDDQSIVLEGLQSSIELFGRQDGHVIVGKAKSLEEVTELLNQGIRPSVAIVDNNFYGERIGSIIAEKIREISPETKIISFSSDWGLTWGDENWNKHLYGKDLIKALTDLQH